MNSFIDQEAQQDFNKARSQEAFSRIMSLLNPTSEEMLSLQEVKDLLRPKTETYRGMQTVEIDRIVGSEGRYRDFNKRFLPKHEYLRNRWMRVDKAHLQHIILPPIRLYEVGGVYFVRDGNHRVSVARSQGVKAIDAEVVSLDSEIELAPNMGKTDLLRAVIEYERRRFFELTHFDRLVPQANLEFTAPGRYDEIVHHIYGHKYYINEHYRGEIPIETAIISWYNNVYRPIVDIIEQNGVLRRFPRRTEADLYVWIVKHWHLLKERYGSDFPMKDAAIDFARRYGKTVSARFRDGILRAIATLTKRRSAPGPIDDN